MLSRSSTSSRTLRLAWEPGSYDLALEAPEADSSPQPHTGPRLAIGAPRIPSDVIIAADPIAPAGTVPSGAQLEPTSRHHSPGPHSPPPSPPQQSTQCGGQPTKPLASYYRHDNAAFDNYGSCDTDGGCGGGNLPLSGSRTSSVRILLRSEPVPPAAAAAAGQEMPGKVPSGTAAADTSVSAVAAAAAWAAASQPTASTLKTPQTRTRTARLSALAAVTDSAAPPCTSGTLPYTAARSLPYSCDGAASTLDDGSDDADRPDSAPQQQPHGFANTAAAGAAAAAADGGGGAPKSTDSTGNPTLPTPPLSLRSSYAASFASSISTADYPVARTASVEVLELLPAHHSEPLGPTATAVGATATPAATTTCAHETASWGSAGSSTDVMRGGRSSAFRGTDLGAGSNSNGYGSHSNAASNGGRNSHGRQRPWAGGYGACCGGSEGGGPFAAAAGSVLATPSPRTSTGCGGGDSSTGPKRVQLSISFLPSSPSGPQPHTSCASSSTAASIDSPAQLMMCHPPAEGAAASGTAYTSCPRAAPLPPPQQQSSRLAEATSINIDMGPATSSASAVSAALRPLAAATATAAAVAAAAAAAVPAPGDGVLVVAETEADAELEDTDLVASISVAVLSQGARGGDAAVATAEGAAAVALAAAAAAGGDGEEVAAAGALPPEVRRRLTGHMGRQRAKSIRSWKDLSHSMASQPPGYWLLSTMLILAVMVGVFLFMAGQYEFVRPIDVSVSPQAVGQQQQQDLATGLAVDPLSAYTWGPDSLGSWLAFWRSPASRTFNFDYLRLWGGRYGPDLAAGQWWRWVTSLLMHQSSMHLASNTALFLVLSAYLESLFGLWRVLPVWVVAGVAGNMVSAFFESPCMLVVGSSGAVFGLLGAYVADAALNFESIPLLWLRLAGMVTVAALLVALQVTGHSSGGGARGSSTSHASHIGGFLAGSLLAVLLTPDFKAKRSKKVTELLRAMGVGGHLPDPASPGGRQLYSFWQRHKALLYTLYGMVVLMLLLMLVALPVVLYLRTFQRMVCG